MIISGLSLCGEGNWRVQYGDQFQVFRVAKLRFDPHRILTPGQGIFTRHSIE